MKMKTSVELAIYKVVELERLISIAYSQPQYLVVASKSRDSIRDNA